MHNFNIFNLKGIQLFKVAILGASGYTGLELVRLISMHPKFK